MKISAACRILVHNFVRSGLRQDYYSAHNFVKRVAYLFRAQNHSFAQHAVNDQIRFLFKHVDPVEGQTIERARAALDWIMLAHDASGDGGVSYGYFPCTGSGGWKSSYPEATGYIIPTLLDYAETFGQEEVRQRALRMARWEGEIQMKHGAVQGGMVCPPYEQTPSVFNTGMVLHGWTAAFRNSGEEAFLLASQKAADFLVEDLGADDHLRTHGLFVTPHRIKTYNVLCAWPLFRFSEDSRDDRYRQAALRMTEAALRQQKPNGWFANNCLTDPKAPLLHTIGYTLQGILEVGILAGRDHFIDAVMRGTDPLLDCFSRRRFLHGRFYEDWEPASFSSCLTGSAQLAVVCYRLFEHTADQRYKVTAERILGYLKALQVMDSAQPLIRGAIPGSFPLFGSYMTAGYPSWATKYFLDGLLLQLRVNSARNPQEQLLGDTPKPSSLIKPDSSHEVQISKSGTLSQ